MWRTEDPLPGAALGGGPSPSDRGTARGRCEAVRPEDSTRRSLAGRAGGFWRIFPAPRSSRPLPPSPREGRRAGPGVRCRGGPPPGRSPAAAGRISTEAVRRDRLWDGWEGRAFPWAGGSGVAGAGGGPGRRAGGRRRAGTAGFALPPRSASSFRRRSPLAGPPPPKPPSVIAPRQQLSPHPGVEEDDRRRAFLRRAPPPPVSARPRAGRVCRGGPGLPGDGAPLPRRDCSPRNRGGLSSVRPDRVAPPGSGTAAERGARGQRRCRPPTRPVLKHGPRSLTRARVRGSHESHPWRNEGEGRLPPAEVGSRGLGPSSRPAEGAPPARLARPAGEVEHELRPEDSTRRSLAGRAGGFWRIFPAPRSSRPLPPSPREGRRAGPGVRCRGGPPPGRSPAAAGRISTEAVRRDRLWDGWEGRAFPWAGGSGVAGAGGGPGRRAGGRRRAGTAGFALPPRSASSFRRRSPLAGPPPPKPPSVIAPRQQLSPHPGVEEDDRRRAFLRRAPPPPVSARPRAGRVCRGGPGLPGDGAPLPRRDCSPRNRGGLSSVRPDRVAPPGSGTAAERGARGQRRCRPPTRPVLKHGPRSLTRARVRGSHESHPWRNEGEGRLPPAEVGSRGLGPSSRPAEGAPPARLARPAGEVEHERAC
ncbi:collagen alpha-1(I) chain-like [Antechinus flavipes]|uniref:collagen alpha-1(I) chain-like n=1 Tax=Antechinus flavipes TaxID=38775 RepID=UPI002235A937|nr:collagen alpha-1(I) chain-like [Antechinus flavipes]